jgi:hypothetical protein
MQQRFIKAQATKFKNLVDTYNGVHTILDYYRGTDAKGKGRWYINIICGNCGSEVSMRDDVVPNSHTCDNCSRASGHNTKDGRSTEALNNVYKKMKSRCYNTNDTKYYNYGAKGITICDEWLEDYSIFKEWAYANGYTSNENVKHYRDYLSIDRIDNSKGYTPSNCQWITVSENSIKRGN